MQQGLLMVLINSAQCSFTGGVGFFCVNVLAFFLFVSKWSLYMYGMGKYHAINFNMEQTTLWS